MFLIKAYAKGVTGEGVWRTINGSPVFIQGGKITKGPASMKGLSVGKSGKVSPSSVSKEIEGKLKTSKSVTMTQKGDWGDSKTVISKLKGGEYSVTSTATFKGSSTPSRDKQLFTSAKNASGYATKYMSKEDPYKLSGK